VPKPKDLVKTKDGQFRIVWDDGHASTYSYRYLRQNCACAYCRDEMTGKQLLDPESVPADLKGLGASTVGLYGLKFDFSDGHSTGIYTFEMLRKLCPCPQCTGS